MTGRRTIIKITGKMPKASGMTILTGNSFAFFSASNILLERMSSLNSRERRGDVAPQLHRMPQDGDEGRRLLQPEPVREGAQGVNRASSRAHLGPHQFDVAAKRPASLG